MSILSWLFGRKRNDSKPKPPAPETAPVSVIAGAGAFTPAYARRSETERELDRSVADNRAES